MERRSTDAQMDSFDTARNEGGTVASLLFLLHFILRCFHRENNRSDRVFPAHAQMPLTATTVVRTIEYLCLLGSM